MLDDRATRTARSDGEAEIAVLLDHALLEHDQCLGLARDVAVVTGVRQRRRHDGIAAAQRIDEAVNVRRVAGECATEVGQRRRCRSVTATAAATTGDQQFVVEALLRRPAGPGLGGVKKRQDFVLVARQVAEFLPDDEGNRDALIGRGGGHIRRRRLDGVGLQICFGRVDRLVEVGELRRPVALQVARTGWAAPRLQLRPGEQGSAVGMVGHRQSGRPAATEGGVQQVRTDPQSGDEACYLAISAYGEHPRHVPRPHHDPQTRHALTRRQGHSHEGLTVRDKVRATRQDRDRGCRRGARGGGHCGQPHHHQHDQYPAFNHNPLLELAAQAGHVLVLPVAASHLRRAPATGGI